MKKETGEQTYELKYTGHLMGAESMYLHYGYANWSNVSEKKMKKLKSCYKIEISVPEGNELNFCFRANENEWDNNWGNNYWFTPGSSKSYDWVEITSKEPATAKSTSTTKAKTTTTKAVTTKAKSATSTGTTSAKKSVSAKKTTKK
ncbi:MAG: hypothetical protein IJX99_07030 [Clostridia bacterium]|nr:hypothetical protein [Clostridia bacterium]